MPAPTKQITITPEYVNAPQPGKKNGSVKVGNVYYQFDPSKFQFQKGQAYNVGFTSSDYQGKTYHYVASVEPVTQQQNNEAEPSSDRMSKADWAAKDAHVTKLAIAKSCIEAGKSLDDAELWLAWVNNELPPQGV